MCVHGAVRCVVESTEFTRVLAVSKAKEASGPRAPTTQMPIGYQLLISAPTVLMSSVDATPKKQLIL